MHWKSGIAGGVFVGAAGVISYVLYSPGPEAWVAIGMIAATAAVILAVVLLARHARRTGTKP